MFEIPKYEIQDNEYVFDCETSNKDENKTSVYAYLICMRNINNINERKAFYYEDGDTEEPILKFWNYICELPHKNITFYAHNSKFDFSYLRDFLYGIGVKSIDEVNKFDTLKDIGIIKEKTTRTGIFYSADVILIDKVNEKKSGKNKGAKNISYKKKITFIDTAKMLPMSLKKIGQKILGDTEYQKEEIEHTWTQYFPYKVNEKELHYCYRDVDVLAEALKVVRENGMVKNTLSASAFYLWKLNRYGLDEKGNLNNNKFREEFPVIPLNFELYGTNVRDMLKFSYAGGYTRVFHNIEEKTINALGNSYDVNSLYPYVMKNKLLPYGSPVFVKRYVKDYVIDKKSGDKYECLFYLFYANNIQVKSNSFPTVKSRGHKDSLYDEVLNGWYCLTKMDYDRMLKNYEVNLDYNIEYITTLAFKGKHGIFDDYLNYWQEQKQMNKNINEALYQISKLFNNTLYGKFGQNNEECFYHVPCDRENHIKIPNYTYNDKMDIPRDKDDIYLPLASFITSYAREVLFDAIENNFDKVLYCDTDSMYMIGEAEGIELDSKELGKWDNEHRFIKFKALGPKKYIYQCDDSEINGDDKGKTVCKITGLGSEEKKKISFSNFNYGILKDTNGNKIMINRSRITKGGIKIYSSPIKMVKKSLTERCLGEIMDKYYIV